MKNDNWTQKQDEVLISLYGKVSSREVSEKTGRSRNAVIGRAQRLGLKFPKKEPKPKPQPKPRKIRVVKSKPIPKPQRKVEVTMTEKTQNPIHLIDLKDNQCRQVIGDPRNGMFCGCVVRNGSSYCNNHHRINYVKSNYMGAK